MKTENTNRESQRVTELANEYKAKGFDVTIPRSSKDNPFFLRESPYIPDLIATSAKENLVIEVKSRKTAGTLGTLSEIAERVNSQPSWKFVLVLTNPRNINTREPIEGPSPAKAMALLEKSRALGLSDQTHTEAAFLFAWAALEAALHSMAVSTTASQTPRSVWTLVRDAAMQGNIARSDSNELNHLFKMRNSLLHAGDEIPPSASDVNRLREVVRDLLQQTAQQEG